MAESTLSIGYDGIQIEVGRFLGHDADKANWTAAEIAEVDRFIQAGYRQFLYPPAIEGIEAGYEWSFLKPTTTIDTIESPWDDDGTLEVSSGTCTLSDGEAWPSWTATHGTLVIDSVEYTISSRDDDTTLTVVGDDVDSGEDDWSLSRSGNQDLPDAFGRVIGDFHFEADVCSVSVPIVSEHHMQMLLQQSIDEGRPQYASTRFKVDAGTGHRQEVLWWPIPDDVYTMTYRYEAFTGKIATGGYAVGGMKHSEVIVESCIAVAEQRLDDEKSFHWELFTRLLATAIAQDRKNGARYFGPMGKGERTNDNMGRRRSYSSSYDITYKDETW